jgi:hypothetical protein
VISSVQIASSSVIDTYKAHYPDAGMADIVNNLVAAYCPVIAQRAISDQAKRLALKRFALTITTYLSNQTVTESGAGRRHHLGRAARPFACRAGSRLAAGAEVSGQRQFARAVGIGDEGRADRGQARREFSAPAAIAQADAMLAANGKAKPADLANALILAFCEGVTGIAGVGDVAKSGSLMRYGQEVIGALQLKAELKARPPAAKASQ